MTILFFSATGNSLSAAKYLGGELSPHKAVLKSIPQLERAGEYCIEDDVIGIVFPVYNLTLPLLIRRYLSKARLKADYIFGVLTFGFLSGTATNKFAKVMEESANPLHYAAALKMVDNYLPGFKMEDQIEGLPKKNVDAKLTSIKKDIESRRNKMPHTSLLYHVISPIWQKNMETPKGINAINHTGSAFCVTDKCKGCGTCARVCPVSNITVESKPVFSHHCESCFACIHNCPARALQHRHQKSAARYRNEGVTLKEIIEANGG